MRNTLIAGLLVLSCLPAKADYEQQQLLCHATNIFFEARGEPLNGQLAVRDVVNNRPGDACEMIFACHQFSWTAQQPRQKILKFLQNKPDLQHPADRKAWTLAKFIAGTHMRILPEGYTHFHGNKVKPRWTKQGLKIGKHKFIKDVALPAFKDCSPVRG